MTKLFPAEKIYIDDSSIHNAGRGVIASASIKKGEVIEICPVVVLLKDQVEIIQNTELTNYYFTWGPEQKAAAIALGYGSLYNHSYAPNATYMKNQKDRTIEFVALKNIAEGEEITVNYNFGNPDDKSPLYLIGFQSIPEYIQEQEG